MATRHAGHGSGRRRPAGRFAVAPLALAMVVATLAGAGPAGAASPATASVGDVSVVEGDNGLRVLEVPLSLSDPQPGSVTVSYTITPGTASTPADYLASGSGTVTFSAGQVMRHLVVRVKGDTTAEADETVNLTLTAVSGGLVLGRSAGTVTILDDDPTGGLEWAVGDLAVVEGDAGTPRTVEIPVTISATQGTPVSATYTVAPGSATSGVDYTASPATGTVTINAGQVRKFVKVKILPEALVEPHETLTVTLSAPSAGTIVRAVGTVTILTDDAASLYTWGRNDEGQIGDGTLVDRNTPTAIGGAGEWVDVTGGANHTCAVKTNGTLWCWGYNVYGQLGNGTNTGSTTPVQEAGAATDWVSVDAGANHTCARKTDGTVWCWGWNLDGQLGNGTNTDTNAPVQVGVDTDWVALATGRSHTCAIKTNGTLWCWGWNFYGQLGNGTNTSTNSPVQVGSDTNWASVSGGRHHTCATRTAPNRTLWCWGLNTYGQLGNGTNSNTNSPTQVGIDTNWVTPATGGDHSCAYRTTGTMWCWGRNLYGTLGNGTFTDSNTPVQVGTDTDWVAVATGTFHSAGLRYG